MKQLGSEFKNAGFAGKDQNQRLWDEFSQARSAFYDRRNQYYERLNIEARDNAAQKRRIISELQSLLGVEDFREAWGTGFGEISVDRSRKKTVKS